MTKDESIIGRIGKDVIKIAPFGGSIYIRNTIVRDRYFGEVSTIYCYGKTAEYFLRDIKRGDLVVITGVWYDYKFSDGNGLIDEIRGMIFNRFSLLG